MKSLLFLIQLIDGFLCSFNCNELTVFCRFSFPHPLYFVSSFSSGLVILVFQSALPLPFYSFNNSACVTNSSSSCSIHSEERGACTSATLLWNQTLGQKCCGFLTCFFWMCEVNNTGSATTRILLSKTLFGVATLPTGSYYPGGFSTAEE